jgi:ribonuclease P protein component
VADSSYGKNHRLLSANDFSFLQSGSRQVRNKWLKAYYKESQLQNSKTYSGETRLGISVSKKVGNAVVRNRTKRLLREAFRVSGNKDLGIDILVIVSPYLYKNIKDSDEAKSKLTKSFLHLFSQIKS